MRAVWYDRQGPAADVLQVGELPDPEPGPGEVRVRLRFSGISPGDTKKRRGWLGSTMPYPRVIPHSDGAGVIDKVGDGVSEARVGRRVWVYGAQSYRASGTAAEFTTVPDDLTVDLPDDVSDEMGAALGIPGITAHRTVFADGPVTGATVLVHGVLGAVGSIAAQLAVLGGARVISTVRRTTDLPSAPTGTVAIDSDDPVSAIRALAPGGVDRIIEVDFAGNADLDAAVVHNNSIIAAYATSADRPGFPFWPMLFDNVTLRLFGSDDFPRTAKREAATELTAAARAGSLIIPVERPFPLDRAAEAHERVDRNNRQRVLLAL
ncbi:NADPH:quinone reductase [Actinoplanes derwentensis]|uniref:NADPH2:quinone reductase n=1 Tax=Actinoplanes derwentensis TaxID=113562 RepID=A0A1H2B7N5_9ACTN|nr:NADPH:quinone reductase [Actinoplanes derwentensis]GID86428.1 alcohol dehydrogenase [Actinoplanes derwentensis]SDT54072.1 NADPH2:quinone reductase [Actinoplanes derwentensis]